MRLRDRRKGQAMGKAKSVRELRELETQLRSRIQELEAVLEKRDRQYHERGEEIRDYIDKWNLTLADLENVMGERDKLKRKLQKKKGGK
jgi:antitoxin component HigA of HigAB toxin-antitoxin module